MDWNFGKTGNPPPRGRVCAYVYMHNEKEELLVKGKLSGLAVVDLRKN